MSVMKKISLVLAVLLSGVFTLSAQKLANDGLVLTGSVQGIETLCLDGKPAASVGLYMQFRNDSEVPLLLIIPPYFVPHRVNFSSEKVGDPTKKVVAGEVVTYDPHLINPFGSRSPDDYDAFLSFVADFNKPEPPILKSVIKLEPGGYHERQSSVWVRNGFEIPTRSNGPQKDCAPGEVKPVPKYSSLTVEYHFSLKKYDQWTDLLSTLQERWKRFGHLVLDANGDVTFRSEKILLPLN